MRFVSLASSFAIALLTFSCTSVPKPYDPGASKNVLGDGTSIPTGNGTPIIALPLTKDGNNYHPSFSPDGKKIIYVSDGRDQHKHLQLYEVDIATRIERRITFHDGDVTAGIYGPDGKTVVYASATDEIKEDPYFVEDLRKRYLAPTDPSAAASPSESDAEGKQNMTYLPGTLEQREPGPSELYESRLDGTNIRRLTNSKGFDGQPTMGDDGRSVVFSSARAGRRELYSMNLKDAKPRRLTSGPLRDITPSLSDDGKLLAWVQVDEGFLAAQLHFAEVRTMSSVPLTTKAALNVSPNWHPNNQELVFASNRGDQKSFDLFTVDRKGTCLKRLTESPSNEKFPAFSPDGQKLAFSSNHSGSYQIYIMDHQSPPHCLTDLP